MKMSTLDRILLVCTGYLAAYQIVVGIDKLGAAPILAYTIAYGVLLVAVLLLLILGTDVLDSPVVIIISTIIPLSLALGLIWEHLASVRTLSLVCAIAGLSAVTLTRSLSVPVRSATVVLTVVHGAAGLTIFLLPISLAIQGQAKPPYALVGVGGAIIGIGGIALAFLRTGRPILSKQTILKIFPGLLFLMTACFAAGFKYG